MKKITFGKIDIELTRRCNMRCSHCMRGDAEDKDIDPAYIDQLLDQADMIDTLSFTGGEPLLCLDTMEHIANELRERGVLLFRLSFITNGSIYSDRLVELIKRYREIIDISCGFGFAPGTYDPADGVERIFIGVSLDKYHENHDKCEANYLQYKNELGGIADVAKIMHGNAPIRLGRATALSESVDQSHAYPIIARQRVEVLDKDHAPICNIYQKFKLISPNQKIVCCPLFLCVDGLLRHGVCGDLSYEMIDDFPVICKVTAPIWHAILLYERGRISCVESLQEQRAVGLSNDFSKSEALRLHEMLALPEAQDEISLGDEKDIRRWHIEAINAGNVTAQQITDYIRAERVENTLRDLAMDHNEIARESAEYHHGGGTLPESRQAKPEPELNVEKFIDALKEYVEHPDKTAYCTRCGMTIRDKDGNPIGSIKLGSVRGGAYYKCKLCRHHTFAYDFSDLSVHYDFSKKCENCGKEIIDKNDILTHCRTSLFNMTRYICDYCGHKNTFEHHHGGGTLPESRRPKPEPKLDKSVRCWSCGKVIINSDGRKIHIKNDNRCEYCGARQ